jgi:hypothetical protein
LLLLLVPRNLLSLHYFLLSPSPFTAAAAMETQLLPARARLQQKKKGTEKTGLPSAQQLGQ